MVRQVYSAAVVGSRGFVGSAVVRALAEAGIEVREFTADVPLVVDNALAPGADADIVVWAAGRITPAVAAENPSAVAQDVDDFRVAIGLLESAALETRVILMSSGGSVYGPPAEPPYIEDITGIPETPYGRAKLDLEKILATSLLEGVALRLANVYGPGQRARPGQGVLAHWLAAVGEGGPVVVFGDLASSRDYVYVDDVAAAVVAAAKVESVPAVVNIGSGARTSLGELLDIVRFVTGIDSEVEEVPGRDVDVAHAWLDTNLALDALDWRSRMSLEDGVARMWRALHANN